jgi:hypothetical protein
MSCPRCGKETAAGDKWCSACGSKLSDALKKAPEQNLLVHKRLLMLGGGLAVLLAFLVLLLFLLPDKTKKQYVPRPANLGGELTGEKPDTSAYGKKGVEIAPNAVYGQVIYIGRGQITLKSLNTGKEYTVYVGHRTNYTPRRYPVVGEKVKVVYIDDQGTLKATLVEIRM